MKKNALIKRPLATFLCLILILFMMPTSVFADGTYTFPSGTQSGNNNSFLRYYLTDENAADISISRHPTNGDVTLRLTIDNGWYFEKWDTYFSGHEDVKILSDPDVKGSNPKNNGYYTFYNISQTQPFTNHTGLNNVFISICTATDYYGDHSITAVLKPIVTVNVDDGVRYQVTTSNPSYTGLAANQTAVRYRDDVTITYSIDDQYVLTSVNASGTKSITIDKANSTVKLNEMEKPSYVGIYARLKQQTVIFNANGGSGTMPSQTFEYGMEQTLTANSFTRNGLIFTGWNTQADGLGTDYSDQQALTFTPSQDGKQITLYAQWAQPVAAIVKNGVLINQYDDLNRALEAVGENEYVQLLADVQANAALHKDLYLDLNGYDLTGTIESNNYKVYGMDSTTNAYSCDSIGYFNCTDVSGTRIIPQAQFKSSVTGSVKRYMAIQTEEGYSFHRFYLGITCMSLRPTVTSVGFKAAFYGDKMVISMLDSEHAYGYSIQLEGHDAVTVYNNAESFVSGQPVTLRIDRFDVENYGEVILNAKALLQLSDGTVIESNTAQMTLRGLLEQLNDDPSQLTETQRAAISQMIERSAVLQSWGLKNLL